MTLPDPSTPAPAVDPASSRQWELFENGLLVFAREATAATPARLLLSRVEYCVDPRCQCRDAMVRAISVTPDELSSSAELQKRFNSAEAMHALLDIDTGRAQPDTRDGLTPLTPEWIEYLGSAVDAELLDVLRTAWSDTKSPLSDSRPQPYQRPEKTGRNDPCPCGSGKKFKRCCA